MSKLIKTIVLFVTNTFFVRAMHKIGYSGYLSYELCHPLPVVNGQTVGIEYAEKNAQLAGEFMQGLITEITKG